jgi:beta-glucosidase
VKTVEFTLGFDQLSFLNREMRPVVEPGTFKIMVGGNSVDLIDTALTAEAKRRITRLRQDNRLSTRSN